MPAPTDGYNPNEVVYAVSTTGHGGVEIRKQLDQGSTDQWAAALEAGAIAIADAVAQSWPADNVTIDLTYNGNKYTSLDYPA